MPHMRITYTVESLDTADAWAGLAYALGDGHPEVVRSTIRHLRILGVKSYVLEDPYIDRDYSADYLLFSPCSETGVRERMPKSQFSAVRQSRDCNRWTIYARPGVSWG